jgi:hypothetical protein|tara:strand:- start:14 stop:367 length:354 start_codon:yes stop_codon:yes gene_type:complete
MGTHAVLAVKLPDGSLSGCYVHFDGATMEGRIEKYLTNHTTTDLSILIAQAQSVGGMRSFHSPSEPFLGCGNDHETEFLDDSESYVITDISQDEYHMGAHYRYIVDYQTKKIKSIYA